MGEAEDQAALERIESAEKRLVAMQELGLDTASLLSQLYNARFRVQEGAPGEVEAICEEVMAAARRMVEGEDSRPPRRSTRHRTEPRDEESSVAADPGVFAEPNITMAPGEEIEPSITMAADAVVEPIITKGSSDTLAPSLAMTPSEIPEPKVMMGMRSAIEPNLPQVEQLVQQRVVEAVVAIQETMREEMKKSLEAMRAELQKTKKTDTALIVIPAGSQTPVWSGRLGEALDHFNDKANEGPLEGCETSMRKLSDALSLLNDPNAPQKPTTDKEYAPDAGQGSHPATPSIGQISRPATLKVGTDGLVKPGSVRIPDLTDHDTTQEFRDSSTRRENRREIKNIPAPAVTEESVQLMMSAKTERIMAAVQAASDKTIGEQTLRRLVSEEILQQLKDRDASSMGSSLEPMMVFDPDQVRDLVEAEVNKRMAQLPQAQDREASNMGSSLEPMMVFDPDQVRDLVEAEVNKRMAQLPSAANATAAEAMSDAEWHGKLVHFLPDVLKDEDVRQRLIALIALEAVANPGALGELTGLRGFLRRELRRAVEDVTRDTQPA